MAGLFAALFSIWILGSSVPTVMLHLRSDEYIADSRVCEEARAASQALHSLATSSTPTLAIRIRRSARTAHLECAFFHALRARLLAYGVARDQLDLLWLNGLLQASVPADWVSDRLGDTK